MFRIAHISDLHVLSRTAAEWRSIVLNKRITGYANLILHRGRVHRREFLEAVLAEASKGMDHCVVTGDVVNLALETEYAEAKSLLDQVSRSTEVTVVPGNHDVYIPAVFRQRRFLRYFGQFLKSDLPAFGRDLPAGCYPCVKLRDAVAIIALSSGVPRPPFIAAGYLGKEQLAALSAVLAHPEVTRRTPVILIHHPPVDRRSRLTRFRDGLRDAAAFQRALAPVSRGLVLFGHLHVRVRCRLLTAAGAVDVVGASGAALDHPDAAVRAGYNICRINDNGRIEAIEARVLDPSQNSFDIVPIALRAECA